MSDTIELLSESQRIDPAWAEALAAEAGTLEQIERFLSKETAAGRGFQPDVSRILRAFRLPLADVRVLIVGQDPYPTPGHPIGLSFATEAHVRPLPRSLQNIYRELRDDLGVPTPEHGDLSAWSRSGVMLLNRVLTVRPGDAGSHRRVGWERVTDLAVRTLAAREAPLVSILWGRDAAAVKPLLGTTPTIESAHPSPLSASRGFFGSRPFSRANAMLEAQGAPGVDWSLEPLPQ
ncbi:uracil-DNA glycosylase [Agreia sp. PsM10]|uniref:uracil-DNA glycosylase n=1 Tax=Agreia sp. PsM10 TaxID=3030533 RepID=UPI00263ACCAC|nr:uracil-DNA glycosylase [Agreia sp. PsM10]MDN4638880.1 uracil-DNA glycosylase [Agreia sp. PsM10]